MKYSWKFPNSKNQKLICVLFGIMTQRNHQLDVEDVLLAD